MASLDSKSLMERHASACTFPFSSSRVDFFRFDGDRHAQPK
jgi:hypothetical protein